MTTDELILELAEFSHSPWGREAGFWSGGEGRPLRYTMTSGEIYCPITLVCWLLTRLSYVSAKFPVAAQKLLMDDAVAGDIAKASDDYHEGGRTGQLRARLLQACGL